MIIRKKRFTLLLVCQLSGLFFHNLPMVGPFLQV